MIESISLDKFQLVSNHVLVKLDPAYDVLVIDGAEGKKIELKLVSFGEQEANHYSISGTILKKPEQLFFFPKKDHQNGYCQEEFASMIKASLSYDCDYKFNEGDTIFFNYNAQLSAEAEGRLVDIDGHGICMLIDYNSLYGFKKDFEIVPVNGYIFFKRDQDELEINGIIRIFNKVYDNNVGTVVMADEPIRAYLDGGRDGNEPILPGTRILVDKRFGHRMAYDLHGGELTAIEVCHRKNIFMILNKEVA